MTEKKDKEKEAITFSDLLTQKQWEDYGEFLAEAPSAYARELEEDIKRYGIRSGKMFLKSLTSESLSLVSSKPKSCCFTVGLSGLTEPFPNNAHFRECAARSV
jgi:hypothetical protein